MSEKPGTRTCEKDYRKRPLPESCRAVDRKFDFLVRELERYRVDVAAVQETKWFGADVWNACGYTMVHSGRCLPVGGDARRGEGVGIIMDHRMTDTWRDAGEQWSTVSSRIVSAHFRLARDPVEERNGKSGGRF